MHRGSRGFRDGLRRELPRWRDEGLVSPDVAAALHARYGLGTPEPGAPSFLVVYLLGALLVGAGVVSLVAFHWEAMGPAPKLLILGSGVVGFHAVGFTLWKLTARAPRLGHALTLLGTLVFGASIGLVAQIFHVSGVWWNAFLAFGAGAFVAGLAYWSLPHLIVATALALGVGGAGLANDHPAAGVALGWAAFAVALGLAFALRARTLLLVAVAGLAVLLTAALDGAHVRDGGYLVVFALLAACCCAAPLAAASISARGDTARYLAVAARVAGRLGLYAVAWALSFVDDARHAALADGPRGIFLAAAAPAAALAVAALLAGIRRSDVDPLARGEAFLVLGTAFAFGAGLSVPQSTGVGTALVANLALGFLAAGRVVRGLSALQRAPFWEGVAIAGALAVARFLELDVALWLKGAAFIAAGALVLAAGFGFERRRIRQEQEVPHVA